MGVTGIDDLVDLSPEIISIDTEQEIELIEVEAASLGSSVWILHRDYLVICGGRPMDNMDNRTKWEGGEPDSSFAVSQGFINNIGD